MTLGTATILLVLEATRRPAGWVLPSQRAVHLYAYLGPLFDLVLSALAHRGYTGSAVGTLY